MHVTINKGHESGREQGEYMGGLRERKGKGEMVFKYIIASKRKEKKIMQGSSK